MASSQVFSFTRKKTRGRSRTSNSSTGVRASRSRNVSTRFIISSPSSSSVIRCIVLAINSRYCVEGDVELDLVPDIGEERPRIVVNDLVEHLLIWKFDKPTAWVIA